MCATSPELEKSKGKKRRTRKGKREGEKKKDTTERSNSAVLDVTLIVQLAAACAIDRIEIFVALQATTLDSFTGRHGPTVRTHGVREWIGGDHASGGMTGRNTDSGWCAAPCARHAAGRTQSAVAVEAAAVIGTRSVVTILAASHGSRLVQATVVTHAVAVPSTSRSTHHRHTARGEMWHSAVGTIRHTSQAETTRGATVALASAKWEVTIAVGVGPGGSNARRVEDIGIDKVEVILDLLIPLSVAFLDVLAPESLSLEKLGAIRGLAAVLGVVFLLHVLQKFILYCLVDGLAANLDKVDIFGLQNL
jgi:hypothetical protein